MAPHDRALVRLALDLHPAIMKFDKSTHQGEAEAGARKLAGFESGFKALEGLDLKIRRHSAAGIGDPNLRLVALDCAAQRYTAAARGRFECIGQQIEGHLLQAPLVNLLTNAFE